QAETLRRSRTETTAKRLRDPRDRASVESVAGAALRKGDVVLCTPGDMIPGDGEVIEGVASVDESAITGESAPVIRESGGDRTAATGGRPALCRWLGMRLTATLRAPRAVGLDQDPRHGRSGAPLHRSDDRPRRGCGTAEDAERDRPQHSAGR